MGVPGVEGTFRKCCEFTMEVMRKNQESILTLLEVLLYDPLYVWTVTTQKAATVQQPKRGSSKRGRAAAEEAPEEGTQQFLIDFSRKCNIFTIFYFIFLF